MTALAAFETTTIDINEVYSHARKVAYSFNLSREQVEDHVQEAVIKVMEKIDQLKDPSKLSSWVGMITRNQCLGTFRTKEYKNERSFSSFETDEGESYIENTFEAPCAIESFKKERQVEFVRNWILSMKEGARKDVANAFYLEAKTVTEISEELDLNSSTILSHLRRFRMSLGEGFNNGYENYVNALH